MQFSSQITFLYFDDLKDATLFFEETLKLTKVDDQGFITRCRSRLVVRGDLQVKSTIETTYAATLAGRSFRIIMAIVAKNDLETKQFDVVNAFVNAQRDPTGTPVAPTVGE